MSAISSRIFLACLRRGVAASSTPRRAFACVQAKSSLFCSFRGGTTLSELFFSPGCCRKISNFSSQRGRETMLDAGGDSNGGAGTNGSGIHVAKLRGLPFSTTAEEVLKFLGPSVDVLGGINGVHLTETRPGRPSGECFVRLASAQDLELALSKHKEHMGKRYIEVFSSDELELEWALSSRFSDQGGNTRMPDDAPIVKLRGLPFGATRDDILKFFDGLAVAPDGITMLSDHTGRASGEAFVRFVDADSAMRALDKDREKIGHRYIEVFESSVDEVRAYAARNDTRGPPPGRSYGRPSPYDRGDRFQGGGGGGGGGRFGGRGGRGGGGGGGGGGPMFRGDVWGPRGGGGGGGGGGIGGGSGGGAWGRGGDSGGPHGVHMRGLPFKATQQDIAFFFKPVRPVSINILYDNNNRPSGEADVQFECHEDAMRAMRRDRTNMEHRYIELFLNSAPGGGGGGGGGGGFRR